MCAKCPPTAALLKGVAAEQPHVAHIEIDAAERLDLARELGIMRTPTTLVLDSDGVVVARMDGAPSDRASARGACGRAAAHGVRYLANSYGGSMSNEIKDVQIDPRGYRFGASVTLVISIIALVLGANTAGVITMGVLALLFLPGATVGPQVTLQSWIFRKAHSPTHRPALGNRVLPPPAFCAADGARILRCSRCSLGCCPIPRWLLRLHGLRGRRVLPQLGIRVLPGLRDLSARQARNDPRGVAG